jgi:hypothetical protein
VPKAGWRAASFLEHCIRTETVEQPTAPVGHFGVMMVVKQPGQRHLEDSPLQMVAFAHLFEEIWLNRIPETAGCGNGSPYSSLFCMPSVFVTGERLCDMPWVLTALKLSLKLGEPPAPLPSPGSSTCWRVFRC